MIIIILRSRPKWDIKDLFRRELPVWLLIHVFHDMFLLSSRIFCPKNKQERTKPTRRQVIVSTFTSMGKFFSRGERSVDGFLGSQSDTSLSLVRRDSFSIAGNLRANFQGSKSKLKGIKQYTIKKKKRFKFEIANWMDRMNFPFMNFFAHCCSSHEHYNPDEYSYRPGVLLFNYINWTFRVSDSS